VIVLDTNVLSEPLRVRPDPYVIQWFEHLVEDAAVTAITVGEILTGVRALPVGRRREDLMASVEHTFLTYSDRVLAYDESAAREFASMQEARRLAGRPLSVEDGMIAAICRVRGLTLATRNLKDFHDLGIDLIDPWAH
jgi:predicted nucleic acid-binding protein